MEINEVFYSFQAEGINTGRQAIFVRTSGCNLRCRYCDTAYAFKPGTNWGVKGVVDYIRTYHADLVVITGGEPLRQVDEVKSLVSMLNQVGKYDIEVITNGSLPIWSGFRGMWSMDIKCPSSGMSYHIRYENLGMLRKRDQVKFVISNIEDIEFAQDILTRYPIRATVLFQPAWGTDQERIVSEIMSRLPNVRFSFQVHKWVYGPDRRGI